MSGTRWNSLRNSVAMFIRNLQPGDLVSCILFNNEVRLLNQVPIPNSSPRAQQIVQPIYRAPSPTPAYRAPSPAPTYRAPAPVTNYKALPPSQNSNNKKASQMSSGTSCTKKCIIF